jgi:Peptidase family M28
MVTSNPERRPMFKGDRVLAGLALFLLCLVSIGGVVKTPAPRPATAPDTVFSAERAMRHVDEIAVRPHAMGMPDHDRVRDYVLSQLIAFGLRPQVQITTGIGTRYQVAGRVQNVLAWIPGSGTHGRAVLLVAHYDGVEASPAAADDGAGTAALLETVRALRSRRTPLTNDIIALFTDGEETGLLGAAAFAREHPWAKDVAVVVNVEARGTSGRAFMFETGAGNLDAVRVLRSVGNTTAGSIFTTVYRTLPNDTDLSELSVLEQPALNFAFVEGVERYHTGHDDIAHLNPGSVQHQGDQLLGLARAFGNGTLPRPRSGDAVFFNLPVLGLVIYPVGWSIPLAIIVCIAVGVAAFRARGGVITGLFTSILAVVLCGLAAWGLAAFLKLLQGQLPWGGDPKWIWTSGVAVALLSLAIVLGATSLTRRWTGASGTRIGAMIVFALSSLALAFKAPGASYLLIWPALFASLAAIAPRWSRAVEWVAAIVTTQILVGFAFVVSVVVLGVTGLGAVMLGVLSALIALLLLPQLELISGRAKWLGAGWVAIASAAVVVIGAIVTRWSAAHPVSTSLVYAENADSTDAWFGTFGGLTDAWTMRVVGAVVEPPRWTTRITGPRGLAGHPVARASLAAPSATLVRDTVIAGARRVVLRVHAPAGTTSLVMRAIGVAVSSSSIDGRIVDTTRYRRHLPEWTMPYWAVPDSGAIVALSVPEGARFGFELIARRPGIPSVPGLVVPPRPNSVVQSQTGDAAYVYRRLTF